MAERFAQRGRERGAVLDAARTNVMPLTQLSPVPDFTKVAEASRAWARRVEDGAALPAALNEALGHVRARRGLALLDVRVRP